MKNIVLIISLLFTNLIYAEKKEIFGGCSNLLYYSTDSGLTYIRISDSTTCYIKDGDTVYLKLTRSNDFCNTWECDNYLYSYPDSAYLINPNDCVYKLNKSGEYTFSSFKFYIKSLITQIDPTISHKPILMQTEDNLYFKLESDIKYEIVDLIGQNKGIGVAKSEENISIKHLTEAIYIIRIKHNNQTFVYRFEK